jgi:hypothetical protein
VKILCLKRKCGLFLQKNRTFTFFLRKTNANPFNNHEDRNVRLMDGNSSSRAMRTLLCKLPSLMDDNSILLVLDSDERQEQARTRVWSRGVSSVISAKNRHVFGCGRNAF